MDHRQCRTASYLQRREPSSSLLAIMDVIRDKNSLDSKWIKLFIDYYFLQEERKKNEEILASLIAGPKENFVDPKKLKGDHIYLLERLKNKRDVLESLIDQLVYTMFKEAGPANTAALDLAGFNLAISVQIQETANGPRFDLSAENMQEIREWYSKMSNCQVKIKLNKKDKKLEFTPILTY